MEELAELDVPALILTWIDDMAHPVSTAELLAEHLPDVRGLVISDPADISDWLPAMVGFIEEISAAEKKKSRRRAR